MVKVASRYTPGWGGHGVFGSPMDSLSNNNIARSGFGSGSCGNSGGASSAGGGGGGESGAVGADIGCILELGLPGLPKP